MEFSTVRSLAAARMFQAPCVISTPAFTTLTAVNASTLLIKNSLTYMAKGVIGCKPIFDTSALQCNLIPTFHARSLRRQQPTCLRDKTSYLAAPLRQYSFDKAGEPPYGERSSRQAFDHGSRRFVGKRDFKFQARMADVDIVREVVTDVDASRQTWTAAAAVAADPGVSGDAIRHKFLKFYEKQGHSILPSSSLVPSDPTVLLTIEGMLQFKPIFLGQVPRSVARATTAQKCIRTNDVENVGRTARHHTFFEMLGNFSFGDYFKEDAARWAWDLSVNVYKLSPERVWISVFEDDDEALLIWRDKVGVPEERIKRMGAADNFWASGATGPCGPCSEMYFDFHPERGTAGADLGDDSRFIEFYNLVFMQYNRTDGGELVPLKNRSIDTGLGLERMAQILQKVPNVYETDLVFPVVMKVASLATIDYSASDEQTKTQLQVIGDHARAVVHLISDGVTPSKGGSGYVVRRLIRRIVRMGRMLGIRGDGRGDLEGAFLPELAKEVVAMGATMDPYLEQNAEQIYTELRREELKFMQTLEEGEKLLGDLLVAAKRSHNGTSAARPMLSGLDAFKLYDKFGFPVEITEEVAAERGVGVDLGAFEAQKFNQLKQRKASPLALATIKSHFPRAMEEESFIKACAAKLFELGFSKDNCIALVNTCRDEVCRVLVSRIDKEFGLSFNIAGLGGLITCGTTGMKAGMSHSPEFPSDADGKLRERYVFFAFPHVSIGETGEVGSILRRGRGKPSSACGALIQIKTDAAAKKPLHSDPDDMEYSILKKKVLATCRECGEEGPSLVSITKAALEVITGDLETLIAKTVSPDTADYAVITGVQIHSSSLEPGEAFSVEKTVDYIAPSTMYTVISGERHHIYCDVKQAVFELTSTVENFCNLSDDEC